MKKCVYSVRISDHTGKLSVHIRTLEDGAAFGERESKLVKAALAEAKLSGFRLAQEMAAKECEQSECLDRDLVSWHDLQDRIRALTMPEEA